ncbi:MAG: hypothetical protein K9L60_13095 [Methylovulum sp.]|nr:hypothetical protein [Methylovulum sp.]MCF7999944.1 hypothetical protein [Methylovulum sp.]
MKALLQNHIAISGIRTFEELAHIKRLATFDNPAYPAAIRAVLWIVTLWANQLLKNVLLFINNRILVLDDLNHERIRAGN